MPEHPDRQAIAEVIRAWDADVGEGEFARWSGKALSLADAVLALLPSLGYEKARCHSPACVDGMKPPYCGNCENRELVQGDTDAIAQAILAAQGLATFEDYTYEGRVLFARRLADAVLPLIVAARQQGYEGGKEAVWDEAWQAGFERGRTKGSVVVTEKRDAEMRQQGRDEARNAIETQPADCEWILRPRLLAAIDALGKPEAHENLSSCCGAWIYSDDGDVDTCSKCHGDAYRDALGKEGE